MITLALIDAFAVYTEDTVLSGIPIKKINVLSFMQFSRKSSF